MTLKDDLVADVEKIFKSTWSTRKGTVVPEYDDIALEGNEGVELTATVLYADLSSSTNLVDTHTAKFAAEIYKTYLLCTARLIRHRGGKVTAYDGDRIMGVFIGEAKNTSAVKTALNINYAVVEIINPALTKQYPKETYSVNHVVGIDTSDLLVARTGVRGANDLVWVGRSANYAAKLSNLNAYRSYITADVYNNMNDEVKYTTNDKDKINMWKELTWSKMNDMKIYGSSYRWGF